MCKKISTMESVKVISYCLIITLVFCFINVIKTDEVYAVTCTGNERDDIVAYAQSQSGVKENTELEYYTPYNEWFWKFMKKMKKSGDDVYGWSSYPSGSKKGAWCYMFLGWAADQAGCVMTTRASEYGFYIDGRNARAFQACNESNPKEKYQNWFTENNRKTNVKRLSDVVGSAEKGDILFLKSGQNGFNHVFLVASNNGKTLTTIEGNLGLKRPRYVSSRTMVYSSAKKWEGRELICLCKPMYRATATFYTRGGKITSMKGNWEKQSKGGSGTSKYYKYKFFDDLEEYNGVKTKLPTSKQVTKANDEFLGWYTKADFSGKPVTTVPAKQRGNITYYAKWKSDDSSDTPVTTPTPTPTPNLGLSGTPVTTPIPDPGPSDTPITTPTPGPGHLGFPAEVYNVTLHPNRGTIKFGKDVTSYVKGIGAILPNENDIYRLHYSFGGWYDNEDCNGERVFMISPKETGAKEFWADWIPDAYNVTLHPEGGTIAPGANVTQYKYSEGTDLPSSSQITKPECEFGGWYDNSSFSGGAVSRISNTDYGDKEYWAKWITYDVKIKRDLLYVYGARNDPDIHKADVLEFKVETESNSTMQAYFTSGESPNSPAYPGKVNIRKGTNIKMKLPDSVVKSIARNKQTRTIYLQIVTQTNVRITRAIRIKFVMAIEER